VEGKSNMITATPKILVDIAEAATAALPKATLI
jgi:hypothetical protein